MIGLVRGLRDVQRQLPGVSIVLALVFAASAANAERRAQGSAQRDERKAEPQPSKTAEEKKKSDSELAAVPFVGGDSDMGWGGGFIASWARMSPRYDPFLARIEVATVVTARKDERIELPFTDSYVLFDLPHVLPNRLRLRLRFSYTRETRLKYYGLGNASAAAEESEVDSLRYGRTHPTADLQAEYRITDAVHLLYGVSYTQNWMEVQPGSRLEHDLNEGSPTVQALLGEVRSHSVLAFSYGAAFDTRDDLVNPHSGLRVSGRIDLSPGGGDGQFSHRFARTNGAVKGFIPLVPRRLTLALRVVTDFLVGAPPFYELARYDNTSAIGGVHGVRGIPAGRYAGKAKVFGSAELRSELLQVKILGKPLGFGLTGFVDAGRVWADYRPHPELDGTGLDLKYGVGGGLRVIAGKSFVLRLDVAWAKEANPVSGYLTSGHAF